LLTVNFVDAVPKPRGVAWLQCPLDLPDHLGCLRCRQQTVVFLLDHAIALAGALFQPIAVEHRDAATSIPDQSSLMLVAGRFGDTLATHAQHVGDQFLRHHELLGLEPIQA